MTVSTATDYRCQHCGGVIAREGPRHRCPEPLAVGARVRVHHRDGATELASVLAVHGRGGRDPPTYVVRFDCGCAVRGVAATVLELVDG